MLNCRLNKMKNLCMREFIKNIIVPILLLSGLFFVASCENNQKGYFAYDGITQGTTFHIIFDIPQNLILTKKQSTYLKENNGGGKVNLYQAICDSIDTYLKEIDNSVSGYNKKSFLSRFNASSEELFAQLLDNSINDNDAQDKQSNTFSQRELLRQYQIFMANFDYAREIYQESSGLVDCSAAPLFDLWGFGFKNKLDVTQSQIDSVMEFIGMDKFCVVEKQCENSFGSSLQFRVVEKLDPRCRLNFNAIAQGFTVDYIANKLAQIGIENFLVEVGGEIIAKGVNKEGKSWKVGIDKPIDGNDQQGVDLQEVIELKGGGLVTSGDYRKFYIKDGKKVSHTINPQTGFPVSHNLLSATVMSETAIQADGYATLLMVLGLEQAKKYVLSCDKITDALLIYGNQDSMYVWKSWE